MDTDEKGQGRGPRKLALTLEMVRLILDLFRLLMV
jgi:hypothetical protein